MLQLAEAVSSSSGSQLPMLSAQRLGLGALGSVALIFSGLSFLLSARTGLVCLPVRPVFPHDVACDPSPLVASGSPGPYDSDLFSLLADESMAEAAEQVCGGGSRSAVPLYVVLFMVMWIGLVGIFLATFAAFRNALWVRYRAVVNQEDVKSWDVRSTLAMSAVGHMTSFFSFRSALTFRITWVLAICTYVAMLLGHIPIIVLLIAEDAIQVGASACDLFAAGLPPHACDACRVEPLSPGDIATIVSLGFAMGLGIVCSLRLYSFWLSIIRKWAWYELDDEDDTALERLVSNCGYLFTTTVPVQNTQFDVGVVVERVGNGTNECEGTIDVGIFAPGAQRIRRRFLDGAHICSDWEVTVEPTVAGDALVIRLRPLGTSMPVTRAGDLVLPRVPRRTVMHGLLATDADGKSVDSELSPYARLRFSWAPDRARSILPSGSSARPRASSSSHSLSSSSSQAHQSLMSSV